MLGVMKQQNAQLVCSGRASAYDVQQRCTEPRDAHLCCSTAILCNVWISKIFANAFCVKLRPHEGYRKKKLLKSTLIKILRSALYK